VQQPCLVYALTTHQELDLGRLGRNERRLLHRQWRETRGAAGEEAPQP
jgi:hypothetical protein